MNLKDKTKRIALLPIKVAGTLKHYGIKETAKRVKTFTKKALKIKPKPRTYKDYIDSRLKEIKNISQTDLENLTYKPKFTIFIIKKENSTLDLSNQVYTNFEVKLLNNDKNLVSNLNNEINNLKSDYFSIVHSDDKVYEDYLYEIAKKLNENREVGVLFFDEEYLAKNEETKPFFKPDFSIDTFTSINYFGHPVFNTKISQKLKGFDENFSNLFEYDLALKISEKNKTTHITKVLYSNFNKPIPSNDQISNEISEESLGITTKLIQRNKLEAEAEKGLFEGSIRIKRKIIDQKKKVSIIIPTKNNWAVVDTAIKSIEEKSTYRNFEIIIINNNSDDPESLEYFKKSKHKVLDLPIPFNFAKLNNEGFKSSTGDYVLFLNNDTEVITPDWLESMVEHVQRKEVGMVGPKLLYPDNTIQHAGLVMGIHGIAAHGMKYLDDKDNGYFGAANIVREVSALTGAAIIMRSEIFKEVGMFNEDYMIAFNDLDLCMKVKDKGYKIIYTPFAKLYHYESKTRGKVPHPIEYHEGAMFINRWGSVVHTGDPFYNPNLTLEKEDFSLR